MAHLTEVQFEDAGYGMRDDREMWRAWRNRPWSAFTVIPGVAAA